MMRDIIKETDGGFDKIRCENRHGTAGIRFCLSRDFEIRIEASKTVPFSYNQVQL